MKPWRVVFLVFGSLLALLGLALLVAGGVLGWAEATQRDDAGFFTTSTQRFHTRTAAITTRDIDLGSPGPDDWWSERDIATVARQVSKPLCVNMGFGIRSRSTTPLLSAARLQELGVGAVIYPRLLTACAVQGMKNGLDTLLQELRTGKIVSTYEGLESREKPGITERTVRARSDDKHRSLFTDPLRCCARVGATKSLLISLQVRKRQFVDTYRCANPRAFAQRLLIF